MMPGLTYVNPFDPSLGRLPCWHICPLLPMHLVATPSANHQPGTARGMQQHWQHHHTRLTPASNNLPVGCWLVKCTYSMAAPFTPPTKVLQGWPLLVACACCWHSTMSSGWQVTRGEYSSATRQKMAASLLSSSNSQEQCWHPGTQLRGVPTNPTKVSGLFTPQQHPPPHADPGTLSSLRSLHNT